MSSDRKKSKSPARELERRIDPEDGQARTFEELQNACKTRYTEQEIKEYWEKTMKPLRTQGYNVAADPFLTHASQNSEAASRQAGEVPTAGPPAQAQTRPSMAGKAGAAPTADSLPSIEGLANVRRDPFMADPRYVAGPDQNDPFATAFTEGGSYGSIPSRRSQLSQAAKLFKADWTESLYKLLGPGDLQREPAVRNVLIVCLWVIFLWIVLMRVVLSHYSVVSTNVLVSVLSLASTGSVLVWSQGRREGPISLLTIGLFGLVATLGGSFVGRYGYETYWREYWWLQTGFQGGFTTASTPAMARSDFSVLNFWDSELQSTNNETRVDSARGVGYKDTDYYCVAPILSPEIAGAHLIKVNYWAVGINCCQASGHFTCDGARQWNAGYGVVMLGDGYPCPTCNVERFRRAVAKAEGLHGLVSAKGAKFVRFVVNPQSIETAALLQCLGFLVLTSVLAGLAFAFIGWLAWYYGLGISRSLGPSDLHQASADIALQAIEAKRRLAGGDMYDAPPGGILGGGKKLA
mmetsp:Transcript_64106/g.134776  ORF Transcript_64106/g.134776 Transcript_64106/m.134776 type:complete len:521 (+) Transcript_64106:240-1802(+)|eukprot:CAMPEP_0206428176 /NCGR_PEP_ID=MMETSP0324_2-20121206/5493_1 /ASSEMBLY_ACC=CAM_ASM_000836 /TAXON_ID=2866 /ORGANISM="Crypthecodinium cohnii, Strain Seligo" /LENGTH=520 /DNA_ID=CAMNT_0053893623 /DNA_START=165 /DNA_END=1727 /DNA_ORIENTATION=-